MQNSDVPYAKMRHALSANQEPFNFGTNCMVMIVLKFGTLLGQSMALRGLIFTDVGMTMPRHHTDMNVVIPMSEHLHYTHTHTSKELNCDSSQAPGTSFRGWGPKIRMTVPDAYAT
jgi:hypothetical protein